MTKKKISARRGTPEMSTGRATAGAERAVVSHTPGPWREGPTDGIGQRGKLTIVDSLGLKVADCEARKVGLKFERSLPEDTANARLIAAAPDLLATLKALIDLLNEDLDPDQCAAWDAAVAAIAKAEGRS